ncbi:hypothetical protein LRQ20_14520, partial [Pseudomonas sp. MAFF 311096]
LLALGCAAAPKPDNRAASGIPRKPSWGRFAAQREQAPSPQGIAFSHEFQDFSHKGFRLSLGTSLTNLCSVAANSAAGFDRPN